MPRHKKLAERIRKKSLVSRVKRTSKVLGRGGTRKQKASSLRKLRKTGAGRDLLKYVSSGRGRAGP